MGEKVTVDTHRNRRSMGTAQGWPDIPLLSIEKRIQWLRTCDLRFISLDYLAPKMFPLLYGYPQLVIKQETDSEFIYRARKLSKEDISHLSASVKDKFSNVSDFWYPLPEHYKFKMGRFNRENSPIFYSANSWETAVIETRPDVGDMVAIVKCQIRDQNTPPPNLVFLGQAANPGWQEFWDTVHPHLTNIFDSKEYPKYKAIHTFFMERLLLKIESGCEHEYKITVSIADYMLGKHDYDGIIYPSIAANYRGTNIALKTNSVDLLYKPIECWIFEIVQHIPPLEYESTVRYLSQEILRDGTIVWVDLL